MGKRETYITYESFYFTVQIIFFDIMSKWMGGRGQILSEVFANESWNIQSA